MKVPKKSIKDQRETGEQRDTITGDREVRGLLSRNGPNRGEENEKID